MGQSLASLCHLVWLTIFEKKKPLRHQWPPRQPQVIEKVVERVIRAERQRLPHRRKGYTQKGNCWWA
jgi:hypothetical protein